MRGGIYLSEKITSTHESLYILLNFQVSKLLYRGPEFYYNYLIYYTVGFIIITS